MAEDDKQELEENQLTEETVSEDTQIQETSLDNDTSSDEQNNNEQELPEVKEKSSPLLNFENIIADELLPESGDPQEDNLQQRLKSLSLKSRSKIEKNKITFTKVVIALIIIVGSILVILELKSDPTSGKILIYELPKMTVNVFSEVDSLPRNVSVNVSIGVDENTIKNLNTDECYNIIFEVLSNMTFEQFNSVNVQYNIKNEVHNAFLEKSVEKMDVKVYVSGLDLGKFNMEGLSDDRNNDILNFYSK